MGKGKKKEMLVAQIKKPDNAIGPIPHIIGGEFNKLENDIKKYIAIIDSVPKRSEKIRVLFSTEASYLCTGFSTYLREVFRRLHSTGKYKLAELGCFTEKNQKVLMGDLQEKNIEEILPGEFVITHKNRPRKVICKQKREYSGEVIHLYTSHFGGGVECTPNHPIYAIKNSRIDKRIRKNKSKEPQWIRADELSIGDFIAHTMPNLNHKDNSNNIIYGGGYSIETSIELAQILGWYLAEGWINEQQQGRSRTYFCGSLEELNILEILSKNIEQIFGVKSVFDNSKIQEGVYQFYIKSDAFADFIRINCGKLAHKKRLSGSFDNCNKEFIQQLIAFWAEGDGCRQKNSNAFIVTTTSKVLSQQIIAYSHRFGMSPSLGKKQNCFNISFYGSDAQSLCNIMHNKRNNFIEVDRNKTFVKNGLRFSKINQIHKREYIGIVHNLEVEEDNSYVVNLKIVHNSYGHSLEQEPRVKDIPWEYFRCMPMNQAEETVFANDNENQFGKWKFTQAVASFRPDILILNRDFWMDYWTLNDAMRSNFLVFWMPTVDGYPQKWEWLRGYNKVDRLFTYSWFGKKVLEEQSVLPHAKINGVKPLKVIDVCQPGVNCDIFKPMDKKEIKKIFGIPHGQVELIDGKEVKMPNIRFVGTVMRNQPRKLFPRIIESFRIFKKRYPSESKNVMLLLHTSVPDVGWDIGEVIYQNGIQDDVVFTYICRSCGNMAIHSFIGSPANCPVCKQNTFMTPNTQFGLPDEHLAMVYNLLDLYIQGSVAEGCFAKGTKIKTINGIRNIEDIIIGDKVLTHTGKWKSVVKTFINPVNNDVYDLKTFGDFQINRTTGNHNILVSTIKTIKDKWHRERRVPTGILEWKQQNKIKRGDWVAYKYNNIINPVDTIKITDYVNDCYEDKNGLLHHITERYYKNGQETGIKNKIKINKEFMYFLGLFIAEGSTCNNYIYISSHKNENFIENLEQFILNLFNQPISIRLKKDTNGKEGSFYSPIISSFLNKLLGKGSRNKQVPQWIMTLPLNLQQEFIKGWYLGDGAKTTLEKSITTSSINAAYQARDLLLRQGICSSVKKRINKEEYSIRVKSVQDIEKLNTILEMPINKKIITNNSQTLKIINNILFSKVREVTKINHNEKNYDLQIEDDHSYCLTSYNVHNCGMPVNEAKSCGIPCLVSDYSALYEKARNGGGVPIRSSTLYTESETMQWRDLFDRKDLAKKMAELMSNDVKRIKLSKEARECALTFYNWDLCAKKWEAYIDTANLKDRSTTWNAPVEIKIPEEVGPPRDLSDQDFIVWCYKKILCRRGVDDEGMHHWLRSLAQGMTRNQLEDHFRKIINDENKKKKMLMNKNNTETDIRKIIENIIIEKEN